VFCPYAIIAEASTNGEIESSGVDWESGSEQSAEDYHEDSTEDYRMEHTREQTSHNSGDGNCDESRGNVAFQSTSDASGSTGDAQLEQLSEELARAKERIAMLESEVEGLKARK